MKKLLLAATAIAALSLPAMAQNQPSNTQQPDRQQMDVSSHRSAGQQPQNQSSENRQQQAQNTIKPSQLNSQQIRHIQRALNKQGFDAGHVDGKWGSSTDKAVKNFQQSQKMQASGKLNQQTLQALGVNVTAQGRTGQSQGASTTGAGSSDMQPHLQQSPSNQQNQR
jgi:hypothetical protein